MKRGIGRASRATAVLLIILLLCGCGGKKESGETEQEHRIAPNDNVDIVMMDPMVMASTEDDYLVQESSKAESSYFDDVVFVGDSITEALEAYNMAYDVFGKATFLASRSLGAGSALGDVTENSVHPSYQGTKMKVEEGIQKCGATKIYILLGVNDLAIFGMDDALKYYTQLLHSIQETTPLVTVFVQSVTPIYATSYLVTEGTVTNEMVQSYNEKLKEACKENHWFYLDVASSVIDEDGTLLPEYCSDPDGQGIHFTYDGCQQWADYLYTHTVTRTRGS